MGNYNADANPDLAKGSMIAYDYGFFSQEKTKFDQFSTDSDLKVYKFAKRIGSNHLQILVDPNLIPA